MDKKIKKNKDRYIRLLLLGLFFISCSTQKDAFLNRAYHQLNAKYNGLFYAKSHFNDGVEKIRDAHKDDYKEIISINQFGSLIDAKAAQSSLDRAIEKSMLVIKKHSMDIDGHEKNKLIDDAYMLIAKSQFYKKDFFVSQNTFNYIIKKSKTTKTQTEAALWFALCNQELGNNEGLKQGLRKIKEDFYLEESQEALLFEIEAELAIKKMDYDKAKRHLMQAIDSSKNNKKRVRMYYILGQICLLTGDDHSAIRHFNKVIKKNPNYELVFNSKLNQTNTNFFTEDGFTKLKNELHKMLKDKKNKEYRDQIYFSLAKLEMKNLDTLSGLESLRLSAELATNNIAQKIESHQLLAGIFWDQKNYLKAYLHSDSAYQLIDTKHEQYQEIKKMNRNTKRVAELYIKINYNDSIIKLAQAPEDERNRVIDEYISNLKKEEEQAKLNAGSGKMVGGQFNSYEHNKQAKNSMNITSGGGWYFYNPSAISLGYSEFLSRWGNRKLEDNWRRKNKNQILLEDDSLGVSPKEINEKEKYNRDYYLSQLPLEKAEQLQLFSQIETAYYDLAVLFKEDLADYLQSIFLYIELTKRFPETGYRQIAYFDLCNLYNIVGDTINSVHFLDKIKKEYPNSPYLNLLNGGEAINTSLEKDKKIYRDAYELYSYFTEKSCLQLHELFQNNPKNTFVEQIELLDAFCQAKSLDKRAFVIRLEEIGKKYPTSTISQQIESMVGALKGEDALSPNMLYTNNFESKHFFLFLLEDISINLPETQAAISIFNSEHYGLEKLEITNLLLKRGLQLLRVDSFMNKEEAMAYYKLIESNELVAQTLSDKDITPLVISENNFIQLLEDKNINSYFDYFNAIYLLN